MKPDDSNMPSDAYVFADCYSLLGRTQVMENKHILLYTENIDQEAEESSRHLSYNSFYSSPWKYTRFLQPRNRTAHDNIGVSFME